MITGRPPFRAASSGDTLLLVREQEPVPPSFLNPRVENDLELICLQCLQKHPDHRYHSAAHLAKDLEAFLAGDSPSVRSGSLIDYVSRMMRDTHHVGVLENWGLLWMWHSLKVFLLCALTNALAWFAVTSPWPYVLLWSLGLIVWGAIFWALRRRGGPVMFVERQIAHVWAASVIAIICVFLVEMMLGLEPLKLSPILAAIAGMVFVIKGGMLSGRFYVAAFALFATIPFMVLLASVGQLILGSVSALCFFVPGLIYYVQRRKTARVSNPQTPGVPAPRVPALAPSTGGPSAHIS
jgi:serine/threonine-protein kinase